MQIQEKMIAINHQFEEEAIIEKSQCFYA